MSKVNDFLTAAGVFFLATADGDQPKVRPLGFHMEMEGKVMFGVGQFKDVYKQLVANPKVEIVAAKPDGHWLRYTGTAVFDDEPEYTEKAFETMPQLREIYTDTSIMGVFHIENATAVEIPMAVTPFHGGRSQPRSE